MLKCFVDQIVFQSPIMNAYSQKHTNCDLGDDASYKCNSSQPMRE